MNLENLLSSALLAAIVTGIVTFINSQKNNRLQYITGERKLWRDRIRKIAVGLEGASYKKTVNILTELEMNINAYGNYSTVEDYFLDGHIWKEIKEIKDKKISGNELHIRQQKIVEYLAALLKYDWERSKKEIRGDYMQCISIFMYIIAGIVYVYLILMENPDLNIQTVIIGTLCCYAIILVLGMFIPNVYRQIYKIKIRHEKYDIFKNPLLLAGVSALDYFLSIFLLGVMLVALSTYLYREGNNNICAAVLCILCIGLGIQFYSQLQILEQAADYNLAVKAIKANFLPTKYPIEDKTVSQTSYIEVVIKESK